MHFLNKIIIDHNNWMKVIVSVAVLFLALGFGINKYVQYASKFKDEVTREKISIQLLKEVRKGDYDIIDVDELNEWIQNGKEMVIIDTMPSKHYDKMHIPGAVQFLFPIPEMLEWDKKETDGKSLDDYEAILGKNKDIPVVLYCGFVKCSRSHNAALWARKLGYENVFRLPGGIFAWKGADFDIE